MARDPSAMVRVAASGDLHCREDHHGRFRNFIKHVNEVADVLLLPGPDRPGHPGGGAQPGRGPFGAPDPMRRGARQPRLRGRSQQAGLRRAGQGLGSRARRRPLRLREDPGGGGHQGLRRRVRTSHAQAFGESPTKAFVQEGVDESLKLEAALGQLDTPKKVVMLHYSPVPETLLGEQPEIMPFLGTSRLAYPIDHYGAAVVFHGHSPPRLARGEDPWRHPGAERGDAAPRPRPRPSSGSPWSRCESARPRSSRAPTEGWTSSRNRRVSGTSTTATSCSGAGWSAPCRSPCAGQIVPELREMGELAATTLLDLSFRGRRDEPDLLPYDPWGRRVDEIRVPEAWRAFARVAAEWGLVGIPHERAHGAFSRIHQAALVHLFGPSSSIYTCPLAMTDGAATHAARPREPGARSSAAVPRLDQPRSGRRLDQRPVDDRAHRRLRRRSEPDPRGPRRRPVAAARAPSGSPRRPPRDDAHARRGPRATRAAAAGSRSSISSYAGQTERLNGVEVYRLKDKLGTRKLPTAELELDGALAIPVVGLSDGVRTIAPMLKITRTWNARLRRRPMRRGIALARDYARPPLGVRRAGSPTSRCTCRRWPSSRPSTQAAFLLAFRLVELLGRWRRGRPPTGSGGCSAPCSPSPS